MAIFHSYVSHYQRVFITYETWDAAEKTSGRIPSDLSGRTQQEDSSLDVSSLDINSQGLKIEMGMGQNPGTPGEHQNSW